MSQNMCLINVNGENLSKVDMFTEDRLIQEWETEIKSIQIPLQHIVWIRRIFSTLLNIYDGVFQQKLYTRYFWKKTPSQIFDRILKTSLWMFSLKLTCFQWELFVFLQRRQILLRYTSEFVWLKPLMIQLLQLI